MDPIQFYEKNKYLILEEEMDISIPDFNDLKEYFYGYKKVIYSIMFRIYGFPVWKTFIYKEPTKKVLKELEEFSKTADTFFVRSDTYKDKVDNPSIKSCPSNRLVNGCLNMHEYKDRFIVVMAQPKYKYQEHVNLANCRMGLINQEIIKEWTGPGFSEYHLGKDKFPHKATVHANIKVKGEHYEKVFVADHIKYKNDAQNIFFSVGISLLGIKKDILKLLGKNEPTNDEYHYAFEKLGLDTSEIINKGYEFHKSIKPNSPILAQLEKGQTWEPSDEQIRKANNYFKKFVNKSNELGIDPNEKIVTFSMNDYATKEKIIFWDIFGLIN